MISELTRDCDYVLQKKKKDAKDDCVRVFRQRQFLNFVKFLIVFVSNMQNKDANAKIKLSNEQNRKIKKR